ncbi:MAG: hypothetical protein ED557_08110 [Balneola sp.]|nr:MAG: hypothetical protein ED557_08110 [Balneola sp.]
MKKIFIPVLFIALFSSTALAQLRSDLATPTDYSGSIINSTVPTVENGLNRFFNSLEMSHSYSMNFSSFGGSYQNVNAYTNTVTFDISPRMNGRVDVSFLHSPFGGSTAYGQTDFQNRVMIENAELNYRINDKTFIKFQFRQSPAGFYGYNPYGYNRFDRRFNDFWY